MIGIFSRADHPKGWGFADGRAHGYVTLFVRCRSRKQLLEVTKALSIWNKPFLGLQSDQYYAHGNLNEWFGGLFELTAIVPGNKIEHAMGSYYSSGTVQTQEGRWLCRGDNRFTGIYDAKEILNVQS
jgi:hypothetical protein